MFLINIFCVIGDFLLCCNHVIVLTIVVNISPVNNILFLKSLKRERNKIKIKYYMIVVLEHKNNEIDYLLDERHRHEKTIPIILP